MVTVTTDVQRHKEATILEACKVIKPVSSLLCIYKAVCSSVWDRLLVYVGCWKVLRALRVYARHRVNALHFRSPPLVLLSVNRYAWAMFTPSADSSFHLLIHTHSDTQANTHPLSCDVIDSSSMATVRKEARAEGKRRGGQIFRHRRRWRCYK